ncbi:MAG: transcription termination/antitermination protein NusG [Bacteroidales bacterium]|nr:transcription termination/antitermination protein NusG [Bacteroidales bacterium]
MADEIVDTPISDEPLESLHSETDQNRKPHLPLPADEEGVSHGDAVSDSVASSPDANALNDEHADSSLNSDADIPGREESPESILTETTAELEPEEPVNKKHWYVVKVTSGREESIKAAIERRVKIEGLEEFYGEIVIPVERITEVKKVKETKNGEKITKEKRVTKERKKFPGYIMAEVEFNDRILYLFRETSGVGDFVGATGPLKPPPPMTEIEVKRMRGEVTKEDVKGAKAVIKLDFEKGDKVRIREGAFANMEGEVKEIAMPKDANESPKIRVAVTIFGREVPVDLDYWQVDKN